MKRNWVAVASADHVARGRAAGFMQVCHSKPAPLRRIGPGDRVVYYAPTATFRGREKRKAFTAIGVVAAREPYPATIEGRRFFRRDVAWLPAEEAPIGPLLGELDFARGGNWRYQLRFGLVAISDGDLAVIARAMRARLPAP